MSWEKLKALASSDAEVLGFIESQISSSTELVNKVNGLEATNSGVLADLKKFKQGNSLVKDSLGLEEVNSDTIKEALEKLKGAKGDDKLMNEISNLKTLLETANTDKQTLETDYQGKLSNMAMTNSLRDLGIGALANGAMSEKMILEHLKTGAVLDGENIVYKKEDGSTLYDGTTLVTPASRLESLKTNDDWKPFLKADISGGSGSRESNPRTTTLSTMNEKERTELFKNNPSEFNRLVEESKK